MSTDEAEHGLVSKQTLRLARLCVVYHSAAFVLDSGDGPAFQFESRQALEQVFERVKVSSARVRRGGTWLAGDADRFPEMRKESSSAQCWVIPVSVA